MQQKLTLEAATTGHTGVFPLLTLDVVRTFYDLMGIDPQYHAALHGGLRKATLVTRKEIVLELTRGGPKPTLAGFCGIVESALGPPGTEHLTWWLERVLLAEHREIGSWTRVLRYCLREGDEYWRRLGFPAPLSDEAAKRFATSVDRTAHKRRCADLDEHPLSDWDLHMYASQLYDFDRSLEGLSPSPLTEVSLTAAAYQEHRFWAWVLHTLAPEQLTQLRESALEIVSTEDLASSKDLVHPSALDIGL